MKDGQRALKALRRDYGWALLTALRRNHVLWAYLTVAQTRSGSRRKSMTLAELAREDSVETAPPAGKAQMPAL